MVNLNPHPSAAGSDSDSQPDDPEVYYNLGNALKAQGDLSAAINAYHQALAIKQDYPEACHNLGNVLRVQGNLQAGIDTYRQALAIKADYREAYNGLGNAFKEQGDVQAAMDAYRQALAISPNYSSVSLLQLQLGDYERGWKGYEQRFRKSNPLRPHARSPG